MLAANWDAVRALMATSTQWRLDPWTGRLLGLDYAGARAAARGIGVRWRRVFVRLRVMEAAIIREATS